MCLLASSFVSRDQDAKAGGGTGGLVIYKDHSFDNDSQAEIADYSSAEHFSAVDNVVTPAGQTIRILAGQKPVYIPEPGNPNGNTAEAVRTILAAEKRFPQFASKLEPVRRAWEALPKAAVTAKANPAAISPPGPLPAPVPPPEPGAESANVLRTRDGAVFRAWRVTGIEPDAVIIKHADGVSRIPISELPDNPVGFPPEVIARLAELRLQEADQVRAAADRAAAHDASATVTPKKTH